MIRCKYLVIDNKYPVIFPPQLIHSHLAEIFPTSAGFCRIKNEENKITVVCYGESKSLGIRTHPDDEALLEKMLNES